MSAKGPKGAAPPLASTLPPPKPAKARRVQLPKDALPKGSLPKGKRKAAKKTAPARVTKAVTPPWDGDREAYLAKQAVMERAKGKPIEAPEGAMVIPGVSTRKRRETVEKKLEPTPHGGALKRSRAVKAPPPPPKPERVKRVMIPVTPELWEIILADIADGVTLRQICRRPEMPSKSEVYRYRDGEDLDSDDPSSPDVRSGRLARYARARRDGYDALADEVLEISDDGTNDWIEREREDGRLEEVIDRDHIARSKLRVDSRFKLLAVWDPARYGAMIKHADPNGKPLDMGGKSASDLAIGMVKLIDAARHEAGEDVEADA